MLAGAGVFMSSTPSTFYPCTVVAGEVADSPASETPGFIISNPAEFTFKRTVKETKEKGAMGRVKEAPSYNNAIDRHTVLAKMQVSTR